MGEVTINQKALEDAMLKALPTLFPHLVGTTNNARVEFYNKFQREADEYDRDFVKKCGGDLDTTLIFAGLFSAVASAFIVAVQTQLQPDYTQLSYAAIMFIANSTFHQTPNLGVPPTGWTGPDPTIVNVQSLLYSSLAISLLAAFVAMLGKQWLNRYSQVETHGSLIDRSRERQRKMTGMATWHFDLVMELLPLMLQFALLLLGCALSRYLFTIDRVVAGVAVGFTGFGLLFYLLIVSAATLSFNCPFQTPISLIVHSVIRCDNEHKRYLKRAATWLRGIFRQKWRPLRPGPGGILPLGNPGTSGGGHHYQLTTLGPSHRQPTPFGKETDRYGYVLDSNCIAWMFEKSTDEDVVLDIMKFIPEVVWHDGIPTTPLKRLYDTVLECFDSPSGSPVVVPKLRNKAYLSAKALLHLAVQRKCINDEFNTAVFQSIARDHQALGSTYYDGDSDLESTLGMIDRVFIDGTSEPMRWEHFSFTASHHTWMSHIFLCRSWHVLRSGTGLTDDIKQFVIHSLRLDPAPPISVVTDCLLIISLLLGIVSQIDDQQATDRSQKVDRIYKELCGTFQNTESTAAEINCALEAMNLIAPLSENIIATESYRLFRVVMQTSTSPAYSEEKKWEASRLALHGAYKWDKALPWVEDPQNILTFLNRHFELAANGQNQDGPIQNALRALAYASGPITTQALEYFDPTEPSFIHGLCFAFEGGRPLELRKAALFFLPSISEKWFNAPQPIMGPDEMSSFCTDWAFAVDDVGCTYPKLQEATLTVLLHMINSPHWRPHIVGNTWALLEYYNSVPSDSEPLKRCLSNPDLVDAISEVPNRNAIALWSAILWLKYSELGPNVQGQLEAVTKAATGIEVERYLETVELERETAEHELRGYTALSTDPNTVALRTKIGNLREARNRLLNIMRN